MDNITVKASISLAGFPEGEVRAVERTDKIDAMLESGLLVLTDEEPEAVEAPPAPVEPPSGGSGGRGGSKGSRRGSEGS